MSNEVIFYIVVFLFFAFALFLAFVEIKNLQRRIGREEDRIGSNYRQLQDQLHLRNRDIQLLHEYLGVVSTTKQTMLIKKENENDR